MSEREHPIMGNFQPLAQALAEGQRFPLSFLSPAWVDAAAWQAEGRAAVQVALGAQPVPVSPNPRVIDTRERGGLVIETVAYDQPFGPPSKAYFLYPSGADQPLPGVLALHDHGAFKYYGKEKLVEWDGEPQVLREFKQDSYAGLSWATRLAQRGFAVFVPDAFQWGSRRLDPLSVPPEFTERVRAAEPGSDDYIRAYNDFTGGYESMIAKSLFLAGASWAGMMVYEDRRALDVFLSMPKVDARRVGCGGLSCGGLRSVYLAATDARIACAFTAGFMSTNAAVVRARVHWHTWMFHVPALAALLDFPDIFALAGPKPALALYNRDDPLWTMEGMQAAHDKLGRIYRKFGAPELYRGRFYPGPHKFDEAMQEDAFAFLQEWLA